MRRSGINASFLTKFAGIEAASPGYATIRIDPAVPEGLEHVTASQQTVRGKVASAWQQSGTTFKLDVTVPPNATAEVYVPKQPDGQVDESGVAAASNPDVTFVRDEGMAAVYEVGSGAYMFAAAQPSEEHGGEGGGQQSGEHGSGGNAGGNETGVAREPRLRITAHATAQHRIALAIDCRDNCPHGAQKIHVTVASGGPGHSILARADARLDLHTQVVIRAHHFPLPKRLRVTITGLLTQILR